MKTTKPLSTISYNSFNWLTGTLDRLIENGIIRFYALICHKPEEDENKAHYHVYVEPAKQVDDNWLQGQFVEPVAGDKPLKSLPFNKSKFVDWYWYGLHDSAYLASKQQARKYHYSKDDFITSDVDYFDELVRQNPNPRGEMLRALDLMQKGADDYTIALMMNTPLKSLKFTMDALANMRGYMGLDNVERNGKLGHENADDGKDF